MVQTESRSRSRRQRAEQAVAHALERRWDLAAEVNRALLQEEPDDIETANRLGKALTELGDLLDAAGAYARTLEIDPTNAIARKNIARIEELMGPRASSAMPKARAQAKKAPKIRKSRAKRPTGDEPAPDLLVHSLIEESGKSAELRLLQPDVQALRSVRAGDAAVLEIASGGVVVKSIDGATLGAIEPRAGRRLQRMLEGGNGYAVIIRHVGDGEEAVYIRETYTAPGLVGQASFLTPAQPASRRAPRPYTKSSVVEHGRSDAFGADEEEEDMQDASRTLASTTRRDEMDERGFSETAADDDDEDDENEEDEEFGEDEEPEV